MARLAAKEKMGFYPTPQDTLQTIARKILNKKDGRYSSSKVHLLDPCCGDGQALSKVWGWQIPAVNWGVELDVERTTEACLHLKNVVQSSIYDVNIGPDGCMGLLWLNPPYDSSEGRERDEMRFLKQSIKWLCSDGVMVFIVPERIFEQEKNRIWISSWFEDCSLFRIVEEEFGRFKQAVLFGRKRVVRNNKPPDLPCSPYPYLPQHYSIECRELPSYLIPATEGPKVFRGKSFVSDEDIIAAGPGTEDMIKNLILNGSVIEGSLSPLFPLRKGHLVALITAGFLNGKVSVGPGEDDFILIKGYSERKSSTHIEDDKEITTNTYSVGVRVLDPSIDNFYDIE